MLPCECISVKFSSLECVTAGGLVPAVTVQLLHNLLAVLDKGQSESSLRPHLYAALLSFMQYSQGPRPAQASPHILKALLQAGRSTGLALDKTCVSEYIVAGSQTPCPVQCSDLRYQEAVLKVNRCCLCSPACRPVVTAPCLKHCQIMLWVLRHLHTN